MNSQDDEEAAADRCHEELLAEIGRVLGLPRPFQEWNALSDERREDAPDSTAEPPGRVAITVLGGVIDSVRKRAAWVERHQFPPRDDDDGWVNVWLNLAGESLGSLPRIEGWAYAEEPRPHISVSLTDDRADQIANVSYLRYFGDVLVVVYEKAGHKELCRLTLWAPGLYGVQVDRVSLESSCAVVDEELLGEATLYHRSRGFDGGDCLMYALQLPDLAPRIPIPVPEPTDAKVMSAELRGDVTSGSVLWVEQSYDDQEPYGGLRERRTVSLRLPDLEQRGYVEDSEVLWGRLRRVLAGPDVPPDGPDILIGAVATPFWDASGPSAFDGASRPRTVGRGPWWFPAAWYHYLRSPSAEGGAARADEAAVWLAWLERLAAAEDDAVSRSGWKPEWSREEGIARFALTHLRRQAAGLVSACRAHRLPYIGDYDGKLRSSLPLSAFPVGFARAFRCLPDQFRPGGSIPFLTTRR